ncbi:hypothetical protein [Burkholderia cepacia]|uniref:hypothetical protein n=1 Tax=Burkholderia cepacia TaxID=292 RepID=UPI001CF38EDF|nr:hypothetical protein [Burkholderia cepacia]MCA8113867.1 hypothetical protein [Burkholderia cepacia]MCA8400617.1 hypothetical protein [Burkholderia cepacia]
MLRALLFSISGRLPCRIISDAGRPYLERYYLVTLFGVRVYLHRFVDSDPDRGLHDHPWPWAFSLILTGWYYEQTRAGTKIVRWFNALIGDSFHRVILPRDHGVHECWTIFAHRARRTKEWGFLRDKGQLGRVYTTHKPGADDQWWKRAARGRAEPQRMPR